MLKVLGRVLVMCLMALTVFGNQYACIVPTFDPSLTYHGNGIYSGVFSVSLAGVDLSAGVNVFEYDYSSDTITFNVNYNYYSPDQIPHDKVVQVSITGYINGAEPDGFFPLVVDDAGLDSKAQVYWSADGVTRSSQSTNIFSIAVLSDYTAQIVEVWPTLDASNRPSIKAANKDLRWVVLLHNGADFYRDELGEPQLISVAPDWYSAKSGGE